MGLKPARFAGRWPWGQGIRRSRAWRRRFHNLIGGLGEQVAWPALYQQLHRALRSAIANKQLAPDEALPPERDMAQDLGVSQITVRTQALDALVEDEGLVTVGRQGAGIHRRARGKEFFQAVVVHGGYSSARGRTRRSVWIGNVTDGAVTSVRRR